jgi:hypothetical protein
LVAVLVLGAAGCSDDESGSVETFCSQVRRVPVITERDDLTVPDTATATGQLVTELKRLREAAPLAIRGDVGVLVGVSEDLAVALSDGDEASVEAAKQRLARAGEAWKAASDNVVVYASRTCGLDLGREP